MDKIILLLFAFVFLCNAVRYAPINENIPTGYKLLQDHKRATVLSGQIKVLVGLKQRNVDKLEEILWTVSDPRSVDYGRHLTFDQMVNLIAPPKESVDTIITWLKEKGVQEDNIQLHKSKDFLYVNMSVAQAESIFEAPQTPLVHKKTGKVAVRMMSGYELPELVDGLIDFVSDFHEVKNVPVEIADKSPSSSSSSLLRHAAPRSPRATGAPVVVQAYTKSNGILFNGLLVYCASGAYPAVISPTSLSCSGTSLSSISATVTSALDSSSITTATLSVGRCSVCRQNGSCSVTNIDQSAVICSTSEIDGIPNYLPFNVALVSKWSDGTTSASTTVKYTCGEEVTPDIISRTYSIPAGTTVTHSSLSQAVAEFSENFLVSDVTAYFSMYNLPSDMINDLYIANPSYVDKYDPGAGEGILDIVAIMGTARDCKTIYWAEQNVGDPFYTWIADVLNQPNSSLPQVHSVSYTRPEIIPSLNNPQFNVRCNIEFIKAGTRGLTILVASGDNGVQSSTSSTLRAYDPDFPASSPYVLSVGATQLAPSSTDASCYTGTNYTCAVTEIVCSAGYGSLITSGGGFSNLFDTPAYQKANVTAYLSGLTDTSQFNTSGRGYPDIAVLGHNVQIVYDGQVENIDGTSASAPFMAGMVTLLNDIRLSQNYPVLGWINPLLYQMGPAYFNDVTVGNSDCVPYQCTTNGFAAAEGWDPVTGLGTPIFSNMATYVKNLGVYNPTLGYASSATATFLSIFVTVAMLAFTLL